MATVGSGINLVSEVTTLMHQIGIPAHVKGYQYIRDAILMVVEDVSILGAVTKELYPGIAKKHNTASSRVERGIRHAIELAWQRGQSDTLKRIFGYSMNIERQKPTNSEFIALLADKFRVMGNVS
ncbi:fragment of stage 0 sporulation protein A (part 2/2) [Candidatus Desulfosporosinus infrequens]|uniref:Fragment of stage 0 sporulation protein A (Part 2/2) n=1 Tax=Candidatus Desulfosporosinus infrequens TaxID=2043169 RepID=A0A2U3LL10_9FIRM|nr:fragment of stage 0 sporulation protein A (part 2/2) [Candidatus Desulfosporosinus infrequens]